MIFGGKLQRQSVGGTSIDDFQVLKKIGAGAFSSVYNVRKISNNKEYALKKVKLDSLSEKERENAINEVRILASIRSPNVIQYKEAFVEIQYNALCIVMEFCNYGDLYQRIV